MTPTVRFYERAVGYPPRNGYVSVSKILLIRHGHVEGIAPERFRGRQDVPLSEQGVREAAALAKRVAGDWKPSVVYTSPLGRCIHTGQAVANACGVSAYPLSELNDLDYGAWQWKTHKEVHQHWPDEYEGWLRTPQLARFPGGESLQDLSVRTSEALRRVLRRHATETVALVAHDSTNRVLLLQLLDLPLSGYWRLAQDPCGLSEIDVANDHVRVLRINETHHLR